MKNYYPDLPVIPYRKTSVKMEPVISYLQSLPISVEIKRAAYILFRNESANGSKGVNNNYIGFQSDSGKWQEKYNKYFVGTCVKAENKTGKQRGFLCFEKWQDSIDILCGKILDRGMYVGGQTHFITHVFVDDKHELAEIYYREWVTGNVRYSPKAAEINNFVSMYGQAEKLFV